MLFCSKFLQGLTIAAISLAPMVNAADAPDANQVVATVNGTDITLGNVIALRSGLPEQYAQLPPEVLFPGIVDQLVQQTLLVQEMGDTVPKRAMVLIENERRAIIASEMINRIVGRAMTDDELQAGYEKRFPSEDTGTEYNAAHILVETQEGAQTLKQQIADGADFAQMAREHSTGPSGPSGGALGWFGPGVMVEPFFDAVLTLDPGEVSDPVETQFGWHLIQLQEIRAKDRPAFDDVRAELEEELQQTKLAKYLATLEANATITHLDPAKLDPALINQFELLED